MLSTADRVHAAMELRQPRGTDLAGQGNASEAQNGAVPAGGAAADGAPAGGAKKAMVLIDEIKFLIDHQYMTASQAIWHIFGMPMHYSLYSVMNAPSH
jgi:hypothetical protein